MRTLVEENGQCNSHAVEIFAARTLAEARRVSTGRVLAAFGPVTLRIETCGKILSSVALDPLRHAVTEVSHLEDFFLMMVDSRETGLEPPTLGASALRETRSAARDGHKRPTLTLNQDYQTACLIEPTKRRGIVWFADVSTIPEWVVYNQIRGALHWVSCKGGFGLFHAAALQLGPVGCLITGKSGSGKSTITAAAIANGFQSAGDDFVLIETDPTPLVHAIFDTIKLGDKALDRFAQFRLAVRNPIRQPEDKAIVHMFDSAREWITSGFPLHAILRARLTGLQGSVISKCLSSDVFRALAPSSLLLLRAEAKLVSANCAALVSKLGCYTFDIGNDLDEAVSELAGFMRGLAP